MDIINVSPYPVVNIVFTVACALLLVGLGIIALIELRRWRAGRVNDPNTFDATDVIDALMPNIYAGIVAGEKAVVWALDKADEKIRGEDKAKVANAVYALIPDTLTIAGITLSRAEIEKIVPRDVLAMEIENRYNQIDAFIEKNKAYFAKQIELLDPAKQTE